MAKSINKISAGEFKSKCLSIMKLVQETGKSVIVTKRGTPLIIVSPYEGSPERDKEKKLYGFMKGSITIKGDIISPIEEDWDVDKL